MYQNYVNKSKFLIIMRILISNMNFEKSAGFPVKIRAVSVCDVQKDYLAEATFR